MKCPNCDEEMLEKEEFFMGETSHKWVCPICKETFELVAESYIDHIQKTDINFLSKTLINIENGDVEKSSGTCLLQGKKYYIFCKGDVSGAIDVSFTPAE